MGEAGDRYWLREGTAPWKELTRREFGMAERAAGFHPKPGCGDLATSGFSRQGALVRSVDGRVTHGSLDTAIAAYAHDPVFVACLRDHLAEAFQ